MELLIITGLSGAGKSCAMNALEDMGYFCIDNLPSNLVPVFAERLKDSAEHKKVAVTTDIRAGLSFEDFKSFTSLLDKLSVPHKTLFIDCDDDVLLSRYKQTRRVHPLMNGRCNTLSESVSCERKLLSEIKEVSDYIFDTTYFKVQDFKKIISSVFSDNRDKQMHIHCLSFGFKHGTPKDADYIFDVRFLPNPFYIPELKDHTGLDREVREYVMNNSYAKEFEDKLHNLISFVIPRCIDEGRGQLVIAVGCTGGHHRSVTFVERLFKFLDENNYSVSVAHRDINK